MAPAFEFDSLKSAANLTKHGIDFERAQGLWSDPQLIEAHARSALEARHAVIGRLEDAVWTAIFTYRAGKVRLISVRRARSGEVRRYEGQ